MSVGVIPVNLRDAYGKGLRFRMYAPSLMLADGQMAEVFQVEIQNVAPAMIDKGEMRILFTIPSNLLLSQVVVVPELDYELIMLEDGLVEMRVPLAPIAPSEIRGMDVRVYYAGLTASPTYGFASLGRLLDDDVETDEKALDATFMIERAEVAAGAGLAAGTGSIAKLRAAASAK